MRKWIFLFLACFPPVSDAALINFNPERYSVAPGATLIAPIFISGLPSGLAVGAYDLTVMFDPFLLTYDRFIFSNFFGDPETQALTAAIPRAGGQLEATLISFLSPAQLDALQGSAFELGEIRLTATSSFRSSLSVSGLVSDAFGNPIDLTFQEALVNGPVPESGTMPLCASAFAALAAFILRRRHRTILT
jgi:hypothetical protein